LTSTDQSIKTAVAALTDIIDTTPDPQQRAIRLGDAFHQFWANNKHKLDEREHDHLAQVINEAENYSKIIGQGSTERVNRVVAT
jgi:hypothetical protein